MGRSETVESAGDSRRADRRGPEAYSCTPEDRKGAGREDPVLSAVAAGPAYPTSFAYSSLTCRSVSSRVPLLSIT
jgi:hypothetical protein